MLLRRGALVDAKDRGNQTPLSRAAANQHHGIIKVLLERGAAVKNDITFDQILLWAIKNGYEAIIWSLPSWGFVIDIKTFLSYLSCAAANGHEKIIKLLLEKYAEPNDSLLLYASRYGLEEISKLLLERDIGLRARDASGLTPLHLVAIGGYEAIAKLLLERGPELDAKDKCFWTPLHFAVKGGRKMIVAMLLLRGAILDAKDEQFRTPLHIAALYGRESIAKMLLERGADLEAKAKYSQTPLHIAVEWGKKPTVELLLDKGADIEAKFERPNVPLVNDTALSNCNHFETPLVLAALYGHRTIVHLLLKRGAEVDAEVHAEDCDGWKPLWQRVKDSHPEIAEPLPRNEDQNHHP